MADDIAKAVRASDDSAPMTQEQINNQMTTAVIATEEEAFDLLFEHSRSFRFIENRRFYKSLQRFLGKVETGYRFFEGVRQCESPIELKLFIDLWLLQQAQLGLGFPWTFRILLQQSIDKYRVDMLIEWYAKHGSEHLKFAVECDGHIFHERTKEQAKRDKAKDRFLQSQGWYIFRVTGAEIHNNSCLTALMLLREMQTAIGNRFNIPIRPKIRDFWEKIDEWVLQSKKPIRNSSTVENALKSIEEFDWNAAFSEAFSHERRMDNYEFVSDDGEKRIFRRYRIE